jgi:two-component system response regulator RegA
VTPRPDTTRILVVDDNAAFLSALTRALQRRGYCVTGAADGASAIEEARERQSAGAGFACAVVDLKLPDRSGLAVVAALHQLDADLRIVVLTGYASIATAVQAVKLGAQHYLPKPATPDEIIAALDLSDVDPEVAIPTDPPSVARLEWEHIQTVLARHRGNISATARALKMHRRTLQRKLAKRPVAQ